MNKLQVWAAIVLLGCLGGCTVRQPVWLSGNGTYVELRPADVAIKGPAQGSSSSFVLFGVKFSPTSFHEAERAALAAKGGDVLLDRYRYVGSEGIGINPFGLLVPNAEPIILIGSSTYYVEGTAAKLVTK
jgi:hypothetical protein